MIVKINSQSNYSETGKINVLFLDIDGVLNYFDMDEKDPDDVIRGGLGAGLSISRMKLLAELKRELKFEIVLTSTWRLYDKNRVFFERQMWHRENILLHGMTPNIPEDNKTFYRIDAIAKWLEENGENVEKYVIVDDARIAACPIDNFVQTDYSVGLRECDCDSIRKILL